MIVREVKVKSILSKSKVFDYVINPYIGCGHGCLYCYARYIKKFTGHMEPWGEFVDVKINAVKLLRREVGSKRIGTIWISGLCDPYQPLEREYRITRGCLEALLKRGWPVSIQTKSTLVLEDADLIGKYGNVEVIFTITTADDEIRKIFEPRAPTIQERISALDKLHSMGIRTAVMIAPILPKAEGLIKEIRGKTDWVIIDRLNYHYADWVYRKYGLEYAMTDRFFEEKKKELIKILNKEGIPYELEF